MSQEQDSPRQYTIKQTLFPEKSISNSHWPWPQLSTERSVIKNKKNERNPRIRRKRPETHLMSFYPSTSQETPTTCKTLSYFRFPVFTIHAFQFPREAQLQNGKKTPRVHHVQRVLLTNSFHVNKFQLKIVPRKELSERTL